MNNENSEVSSTVTGVPQRTGGGCRTIYVVDKDPAVHQSLSRLFQKQKYSVVPFASAASLLSSISELTTGVLILDLEGEDMSGLELQAEIRQRSIGLKIIFLTRDGNVEKSVQALRAGAVDILETPYNQRQLLSSIETAIAFVDAELEERMRREDLEKKCRRLTPREREVMKFMVRGISNKHLAEHLGVSSRTVEIHRAKIMAKMGANSLPDLVRMVYLCSDCRPEEMLANGSAPWV
jgi:two-component system response regulator FixJ